MGGPGVVKDGRISSTLFVLRKACFWEEEGGGKNTLTS